MDAAFDDGSDDQNNSNAHSNMHPPQTPSSPPPSFPDSHTVLFDANEDDEPSETSPMVGQTATSHPSIHLPSFLSRSRSNQTSTAQANDGVFANLMAKPEKDEPKEDETPPPYEAAAADAAPPYWETTVVAPGLTGDEIIIEGLPVGNFFSFVWNLMVSMTFQFVGFLLTYLLHTTHAAKNGSRAGLGITLVQYGFYLRSRSINGDTMDPDPTGAFANPMLNGTAPYPYDYGVDDGDVVGDDVSGSVFKSEYVAYILMVVGWFLTIRSTSEWVRLRRLEMISTTESTQAT